MLGPSLRMRKKLEYPPWGVSSRPKHMRTEAKTTIYSALVPCYKFACHVLHMMETYGSMYDDPFDW